jgi:hypothetical protein
MFTSESTVQWVLSGIFLAAGSGYAAGAIVHMWGGHGANRREGVGAGLHAIMCLYMLAMCWPWGGGIAPTMQEVVFASAALWFLVEALTSSHLGPMREPWNSNWRHAATMSAMVWMAFVMANSPRWEMSSGTGPGVGAMNIQDGMNMRGGTHEGMSMHGPTVMPGGAAGPHGAIGASSAWIAFSCVLLALAFVAVAVFLTIKLVHAYVNDGSLRGRQSVERIVEGLTALGTAGAFIALA